MIAFQISSGENYEINLPPPKLIGGCYLFFLGIGGEDDCYCSDGGEDDAREITETECLVEDERGNQGVAQN